MPDPARTRAEIEAEMDRVMLAMQGADLRGDQAQFDALDELMDRLHEELEAIADA